MNNHGATASGPPEVPDDADMAGERRHVVAELWDSGEPGGADVARMVASPESMAVTAVEDDVLPSGWRLLLFQNPASAHGLALYAVIGPEGRTFTLTADPGAYTRFAEAARLSVDSTDDALGTAEFFLDKTRDLSIHQMVLHSPDDALLSRFTKDRTKAEEQLAKTVQAPRVQRTRKGYQVTLYVQRSDKVELWKGTVTGKGRVEGKFTTVVEGLPVDFRL